jgi:aminoglycoside phosphotransferase family enzyme
VDWDALFERMRRPGMTDEQVRDAVARVLNEDFPDGASKRTKQKKSKRVVRVARTTKSALHELKKATSPLVVHDGND